MMPIGTKTIKSKVMAVDLSLKKEDIGLTCKRMQKQHHKGWQCEHICIMSRFSL